MPWLNNCTHTRQRATQKQSSFSPSFWTLHFSDTFLLSFSVLLHFVWGLELNAKFTMNSPAWVSIRKQKCQKTAWLMFCCNLVHHDTCLLFSLERSSALEVSCHTPILQRSTFLTVLEYEVENRGKGPCYSSVLKEMEVPIMTFSSSMKPSQVALLALPSCCECCSTGSVQAKNCKSNPEQHQGSESSCEITLICSNSRKKEQDSGSLRSCTDTCENFFLHIHFVFKIFLSLLARKTLVCIYMHWKHGLFNILFLSSDS